MSDRLLTAAEVADWLAVPVRLGGGVGLELVRPRSRTSHVRHVAVERMEALAERLEASDVDDDDERAVAEQAIERDAKERRRTLRVVIGGGAG